MEGGGQLGEGGEWRGLEEAARTREWREARRGRRAARGGGERGNLV